jgi:hypothetical protein
VPLQSPVASPTLKPLRWVEFRLAGYCSGLTGHWRIAWALSADASCASACRSVAASCWSQPLSTSVRSITGASQQRWRPQGSCDGALPQRVIGVLLRAIGTAAPAPGSWRVTEKREKKQVGLVLPTVTL